ncbi:unnamed protein product [Spirodela intermedia]|uniref:Uncharacterized protein n=1 Tax=Spirodela intermedia TaxID=51605 RepID=A0A7I8JIZ2_SPIIN|nr:unnamed protein product [Spirodela intermedia]CAA6670099.1 unnamed protein product [Spirodela intermedia]
MVLVQSADAVQQTRGVDHEGRNSFIFPLSEKTMRPIWASQRTESSWAFLSSPFLLFEKVTCLLIGFSIFLISIFPRPIAGSVWCNLHWRRKMESLRKQRERERERERERNDRQRQTESLCVRGRKKRDCG